MPLSSKHAISLLSLLSLLFIGQGTATAQTGGACFPQCRSGYLCLKGQCISACNPACANGQRCQSGECVPMTTSPPLAPVPAPFVPAPVAPMPAPPPTAAAPVGPPPPALQLAPLVPPPP